VLSDGFGTFIGGYSVIQDIFISSMKRDDDAEVAVTVIHELTHKLLKFIFKGRISNPYYSSPSEASLSLNNILEGFETTSSKHSLFSYYSKDKRNTEIISHLFEDLAREILSGEASESVLVLSEKLKNWVESYLKPLLQNF
jgi:predicted aminopeptidase